jgi:hypothetical protein
MFPFIFMAAGSRHPVQIDSWAELWLPLAVAVALFGGAFLIGWFFI